MENEKRRPKDATEEVVRCKDCAGAEDVGLDKHVFCKVMIAYVENDFSCCLWLRRNNG